MQEKKIFIFFCASSFCTTSEHSITAQQATWRCHKRPGRERECSKKWDQISLLRAWRYILEFSNPEVKREIRKKLQKRVTFSPHLHPFSLKAKKKRVNVHLLLGFFLCKRVKSEKTKKIFRVWSWGDHLSVK